MTTSTRKNTIIPTAMLTAFLLMTPLAAQEITGADWLADASATTTSATSAGDDWPWESAGDDDWPWEYLGS